jgi:hypothetical protein
VLAHDDTFVGPGAGAHVGQRVGDAGRMPAEGVLDELAVFGVDAPLRPWAALEV